MGGHLAGRRRFRVGRPLGGYGMLVVGVALFVVFSLVLPETFPTGANAMAIVSGNAVTAILALGVTVPIATGRFDLSIGYGLGLWQVLTLQLIVAGGVPWPVACLGALAGGVAVGVLNGVLVEFARIDSFIATLGTGSVMYALTGWLTGGARVLPAAAGLPPAFMGLYEARLLGVPLPAWYVFALAVSLWVVLERLPLGRCLYVIGSSTRTAELVGIPVRRYIVYAFAGSGVVTGAAGILLAAQQEMGDPSVGLDYLLPAFVAALLGSTTIRPGRANPIGTVVTVAVLAIGLSGIGQLGAAFWVTPLFNGVMLLIAVGLAGYSARRSAPREVAGRGSGAGPAASAGAGTFPADHPPAGEGAPREDRP